MLAEPLLDEVVRTKAALARPAVNQRVIEALGMSRRLPNARMHQNAGIEPDDVPTLVDESAPPQLFDIAFELNSKRPVVPGVCQTTINVRARENEPAALAERGNLIHGDDARLLDGTHRFALSRHGSHEEPGNTFISQDEIAVPASILGGSATSAFSD